MNTFDIIEFFVFLEHNCRKLLINRIEFKFSCANENFLMSINVNRSNRIGSGLYEIIAIFAQKQQNIYVYFLKFNNREFPFDFYILGVISMYNIKEYNQLKAFLFKHVIHDIQIF